MQYYGSQFVIAVFPDKAGADNGNRALKRLGKEGMTIYRSAIHYKNSEGSIIYGASGRSIVCQRVWKPSLAGAVGGALFGISAELTNRGVAHRIYSEGFT